MRIQYLHLASTHSEQTRIWAHDIPLGQRSDFTSKEHGFLRQIRLNKTATERCRIEIRKLPHTLQVKLRAEDPQIDGEVADPPASSAGT